MYKKIDIKIAVILMIMKILEKIIRVNCNYLEQQENDTKEISHFKLNNKILK